MHFMNLKVDRRRGIRDEEINYSVILRATQCNSVVKKYDNISTNITKMTNPIQFNQKQERILSVDFFRGLTMFLLIGESTELYSHIESIKGSSIMHFLGTQLSHHEWNGLHFWDLIQPFFMFIVGVAIPFAVANRIKKGRLRQNNPYSCH